MVLPLSMATIPLFYFWVGFKVEESELADLSWFGLSDLFSFAKATKTFIMGSNFCMVCRLAASYASFPNDLTMALSP